MGSPQDSLVGFPFFAAHRAQETVPFTDPDVDLMQLHGSLSQTPTPSQARVGERGSPTATPGSDEVQTPHQRSLLDTSPGARAADHGNEETDPSYYLDEDALDRTLTTTHDEHTPVSAPMSDPSASLPPAGQAFYMAQQQGYSVPPSDMLSMELRGISNLALSTPSRGRNARSDSAVSDASSSDTGVAYEAPASAPMPATPQRSSGSATAVSDPSPKTLGLDEETPVKPPSTSAHMAQTNMPPAGTQRDEREWMSGASPVPGYMPTRTMPPMTPIYQPTSQPLYSGGMAEQMPASAPPPGMSAGSYMPFSTPEYTSTNRSIGSSVDLYSPGFSLDATPGQRYSRDSDVSLANSPQSSATPCEELQPPLQPQPPYTLIGPPLSLPPGMQPVPAPFEDPFMAEYKTMPIADGMAGLEPGMHPVYMQRTDSNSSEQAQLHAHMSPGAIRRTSVQRGMSIPGSPAGHPPFALPVNSAAMVRKCHTPYSKPNTPMASSPGYEGYAPAPSMTSSKSMDALGSPFPLGSFAPATPTRPQSFMTQSISMPHGQLSSYLDDSLQPGKMTPRSRGRSGAPPLVVSSADKMHVCHCGRRFKRMEHLKRHSRTHTQERPHKCPVESCGKCFGRSDNLTQHLKTHYRSAGLVGRPGERHAANRGFKAEPGHDPHAAATAAAAAAAAAAATGSHHDVSNVLVKQEHDDPVAGQPVYCDRSVKASPVAAAAVPGAP